MSEADFTPSQSPSQPMPLRSAMKHHPSSPGPGTPATTPPTASSPQLVRPTFATARSHSSTSISASSLQSNRQNTPHSIYDMPSQTLSSPPPPSHANLPSPSLAAGYTPKVSFDTFENPAASMFSFTLSVKSDGYRRTRSTRVFLCASSPDESGQEALDWALEVLVQDGDELVVFRGVDEEVLDHDHEVLREEARDLMRGIQEKCMQVDPDRKVSIVLEYVAGKITDTVDRLIALYRPDSVVVGTRGRKTWQSMGMSMGVGMGSISKYCLTHSPVPIIVVRPERKVRKTMEKRRANPKRGTHFDED